jgi:hypothetical protein
VIQCNPLPTFPKRAILRLHGSESEATMIEIEGTLKPRDGVKGCRFTIESLDDDQRYQIILYSPYNGEVVDEAKAFPVEIGEWLLNRVDY